MPLIIWNFSESMNLQANRVVSIVIWLQNRKWKDRSSIGGRCNSVPQQAL